MNSVAWPDGSMISGYLHRTMVKSSQRQEGKFYVKMPGGRGTDLLNLLSIIAFSVQRSSAGRELACQRSRSSALDRYSVLAISVRNWKGIELG